jgi:hypothetical protein
MKKLKIHLTYRTANGEYTYLLSPTIPSELPLSVGVTDSFRPKLFDLRVPLT